MCVCRPEIPPNFVLVIEVYHMVSIDSIVDDPTMTLSLPYHMLLCSYVSIHSVKTSD